MSVVETYKPKHIRHKEIKALCSKYHINNFRINSDYSIDVYGNVNLSDRNLNRIPIKFDVVYGNFNVTFNNLKNLVNSPREIYGDFIAHNNKINDLSIQPEFVQNNYDLSINDLTDFNSSTHIGNTLSLNNNQKLHSLNYNGKISLINSKIYMLENFNLTLNQIHSLTNTPILHLINYIYNSHRMFKTDWLQSSDILDKIMEFEVVKNSNVVDTISLNSLFDYYEIPFYESDVQVKMEPHGYVVI